MRVGTLFSGGGLADIGLTAAGGRLAWAVEYDAAIAAVYAANHGNHVIVDSAVSLDYAALPPVEVLWASPPCPAFSVANARRGETDNDLALADAVCRAIAAQHPRYFLLENVRGYLHSQSYRRILATLTELDYFVDAQIINSADLGVPQTRERLIVRARAGGFMQSVAPWPAPVPWLGWYAAIEDLIPSLPPSSLADWQWARLPDVLRSHLLLNTAFPQSNGKKHYDGSDPAYTVDTQALTRIKAFVIAGGSVDNGCTVTLRNSNDPFFTVTATTTHKQVCRAYIVNTSQDKFGDGLQEDSETAPSHETRAIVLNTLLQHGRVVAITPRALGRFQGVPDSYALPDKRTLAARVIGNGVPPAVAQTALETLLP